MEPLTATSKTTCYLFLLINLLKSAVGTPQLQLPPASYHTHPAFSDHRHLPHSHNPISMRSQLFSSRRQFKPLALISSTTPQTPLMMYPIITGISGPQHPSNYNPNSPATDTNHLLLDFLYDYYDYPPYGQRPPIPQDYGWVWPPSPPPTTATPTTEYPSASPIPMPMPSYKPFKPKPPHHHGHEKPKDKDVTDEDSVTYEDDDDDNDKKHHGSHDPSLGHGSGGNANQTPPHSLFQFSFWRPSISESEGQENENGIGGKYKGKLARLKEKWNYLLDKLKIKDVTPEAEKETEIVNRRPIKMSGNRGNGYKDPISSPTGQFQLEQLPGWNTPPLKNTQQRYPYPIRKQSSNYNEWAQLLNKRPGGSYDLSSYSPYYTHYNNY